MKAGTLLLTCLATALSAQAVQACGDSLYRVGKGVAYRVYSAPLPGNLLVLGGSESDQHLAHMLEQSGHTVQFVTSPQDFQQALRSGNHDVIIAPLGARLVVDQTPESTASFLPVAMDREEHKAAKPHYAHVLKTDDNIKQFLKAIHKTLKARA